MGGAFVNADRRVRLWSLIIEAASGDPVTVEHACTVAVLATGVDGVAVTVTLSATPREVMYASDPVALAVEELTLLIGEGPCVDAFVEGPILVADLMAPDSVARWPMFAPAAAGLGVLAVFALPLRIGGIRLGVLVLYRRQAGDLDREELADALLMADTVCALLLDGASDGRLPEPTGVRHPEVHQATGMVTAQLGVTAAVALIRLRAHAYATGRGLRDVAADVVGRRLRFDNDSGGAA
jgi:hypothetical protein